MDQSREKSLYFLLQAVARQMNFQDPDKWKVRSAIKSIVIKDLGENWEVVATCESKISTKLIPKSSFVFYYTKSAENLALDPAIQNQNSARELLSDLFESFGFVTQIKAKEVKTSRPVYQILIKMILSLIVTLILLQSQFEFSKVIVYMYFIISFIAEFKSWRFGWQSQIYRLPEYLIPLLAIEYMQNQNVFAFAIILDGIWREISSFLATPTRLKYRIKLSVLFYSSAILFTAKVFSGSSEFTVLIFIICIMIIEILEVSAKRKFREALVVLAASLGGFLIAFTNMISNINGVISTVLVFTLVIYIVFVGKGNSMRRFLLPLLLLA